MELPGWSLTSTRMSIGSSRAPSTLGDRQKNSLRGRLPHFSAPSVLSTRPYEDQNRICSIHHRRCSEYTNLPAAKFFRSREERIQGINFGNLCQERFPSTIRLLARRGAWRVPLLCLRGVQRVLRREVQALGCRLSGSTPIRRVEKRRSTLNQLSPGRHGYAIRLASGPSSGRDRRRDLRGRIAPCAEMHRWPR